MRCCRFFNLEISVVNLPVVFCCSAEKVRFLLEVFSGRIVRGFLLHQEDSKPEGLDAWV